MLLLSPGWPSLKSRSANAESSTAATRLVALNSSRYLVQRDVAAADFKAHQILIQRRVFVQREIDRAKARLQNAAVEVKKSAPGNQLARVRRAGERVGIFVVRVGAEIIERDVERADRASERFARREIRERRRRARDAQFSDMQDERFGLRSGLRPVLCSWKISRRDRKN
jgi:hypothetical protein